MAGNLVPASRFSIESWAKNSRFIATIGPAFSVGDARDFISEINQLYADATHNVPAYVIGSGSSITAHSSDNGEPSGTAGKPALSVLMGSGLGDAVLVITRYFGGTKLGTGGLVKAYSNAARDAVQGVPKARKIAVYQASIICPYAIYESLQRLIKLHKALNIKETFSEHVQIDFSLPDKNLSALESAVNELSNGQISVIVEDKIMVALQPIIS
jgi:uncharacterized YigZ family protein